MNEGQEESASESRNVNCSRKETSGVVAAPLVRVSSEERELKRMWDRISVWWCKSMHSKAMWPIHGKYICPDCLREYPVAWTEAAAQEETTYGWRSKSPVHTVTAAKERLGTM